MNATIGASANQVIEEFLAEVAAALPLPRRSVAGSLEEVRADLYDSTLAQVRDGVPAALAARRSVEEFGDPGAIGAELAGEVSAAGVQGAARLVVGASTIVTVAALLAFRLLVARYVHAPFLGDRLATQASSAGLALSALAAFWTFRSSRRCDASRAAIRRLSLMAFACIGLLATASAVAAAIVGDATGDAHSRSFVMVVAAGGVLATVLVVTFLPKLALLARAWRWSASSWLRA